MQRALVVLSLLVAACGASEPGGTCEPASGQLLGPAVDGSAIVLVDGHGPAVFWISFDRNSPDTNGIHGWRPGGPVHDLGGSSASEQPAALVVSEGILLCRMGMAIESNCVILDADFEPRGAPVVVDAAWLLSLGRIAGHPYAILADADGSEHLAAIDEHGQLVGAPVLIPRHSGPRVFTDRGVAQIDEPADLCNTLDASPACVSDLAVYAPSGLRVFFAHGPIGATVISFLDLAANRDHLLASWLDASGSNLVLPVELDRPLAAPRAMPGQGRAFPLDQGFVYVWPALDGGPVSFSARRLDVNGVPAGAPLTLFPTGPDQVSNGLTGLAVAASGDSLQLAWTARLPTSITSNVFYRSLDGSCL